MKANVVLCETHPLPYDGRLEGPGRVLLLWRNRPLLHFEPRDLFFEVSHGFGVRDLDQGPAATWIQRFQGWFVDRKFIPPAKSG